MIAIILIPMLLHIAQFTSNNANNAYSAVLEIEYQETNIHGYLYPPAYKGLKYTKWCMDRCNSLPIAACASMNVVSLASGFKICKFYYRSASNYFSSSGDRTAVAKKVSFYQDKLFRSVFLSLLIMFSI